MSKLDVQMASDVAGMKENMWKLSSRVLLMEKFIQQQFGDVFWEFCQDHVDSGDEDQLPRSPTPPSVPPAVTVTLIQSPPASSSNSNHSSECTSSNASPAAASGPPPPPPLIPAATLAAMTAGGNSLPGGRSRNFLPKSLSTAITIANSKAKPVLRAASLTTSDSQQGAHKNNSSASEERRPIIKAATRPESILKSSLRASPVAPIATTSNRVNRPVPPLRAGNTPPTKPLSLKRVAPIEYVKVETEDEDDMPEGGDSKRMMSTIENLMAYNAPTGRSVNIIRTSAGIKAETDGYSAAHNGFVREMRPNPCHTRCQNRCHDIWTDGDRMDVFQLYWSIPTEEERRQWVAERIERVDMATKKTEYSNFRTCTFKYYFPHPENPRVQVCKNFFLATIDEKRSYVEKIAQEVKGISEHYSIQDIPFRRKNQMKTHNGGISVYDLKPYESVGWMTGVDGQEEQDDVEYDDEGDEGMMEMDEIVP
ncbi:unnamed protein product [Orchesella dallaii]|uniref:Uncharacterized protein n=1 Tax=Orchesella dallaii TaxID=48710 RepID=A0ABP1RBH6_9HEXA